MKGIPQGFVNVRFRDGGSSLIPQGQALEETVRLFSPTRGSQYPRDLMGVDYPDPIEEDKPFEPQGITKEHLIGHLMKDNKVNAGELIEWINGSDKMEEITIVLNGEERKTVKAAGKERLTELINSI